MSKKQGLFNVSNPDIHKRCTAKSYYFAFGHLKETLENFVQRLIIELRSTLILIHIITKTCESLLFNILKVYKVAILSSW